MFLHSPQTVAALRAGKHVLCEKPVAMNYEEACAITQTARETARALGIAYYRRMYPKLQRARELLAQGAIGQPTLAEINCHGWFQDEDGKRSWLLDPQKSGGGPLIERQGKRQKSKGKSQKFCRFRWFAQSEQPPWSKPQPLRPEELLPFAF